MQTIYQKRYKSPDHHSTPWEDMAPWAEREGCPLHKAIDRRAEQGKTVMETDALGGCTEYRRVLR